MQIYIDWLEGRIKLVYICGVNKKIQ